MNGPPRSAAPASLRTALRLETGCDFSGIRAAVQQICSFLSERGLDEKELADWELALVEAGNNAVEHATPEGRLFPVVLEVACGEDDIEARVTDHTPGFDWPQDIALPDPESEGGRGLFLIQALTDQPGYFRGRGENCLVLRKRRPNSGPPRSPDLGTLPSRLAEAEVALAEMTEELSSSYESLVAVFRYSAELGGAGDLPQFARRLLSDLVLIAPADFAVLRLAEADGRTLRTFLVEPETLEVPRPILELAAPGSSIELEAARARQDVWFDPDTAWNESDPVALCGMNCGVCHPFLSGAQLIGTLTLGRASADQPFTSAQINLLHTLSDFLGIQIVNARLLDERMQARVTRRELEIAAEIQRSLLPARLPACQPFVLAASCLSAREVGGDVYDVVKGEPSGALVVVADVMGKGVPAALFGSVVRSAARSMPHLFSQPARLLAALNQVLYDDLSRVDMFATALLVYLDPARHQFICASAGHCPALVWAPGYGTAQPVIQSGLPLGIELSAQYDETVVPLPPRACALLYTDGVTEARDPAGEMLGEQALAEWLARNASSRGAAEEIKSGLLDQLAEFRATAPLTDDQTMVLIHHLP